MIGSYYVSAIGSAHKEKPDGICQDYSAVKKLSDNTVIAAIADGLGSAGHSDAGAKLAVESVIDHISLNISAVRCESYTDLIRQAYVNAYNATLDLAKGMQIDPREFNTTLTVAIYHGKDLYYGQCGDGGIIALTVQGEYVRVTSAEKGESFNETHPLLNGEEYWSFGIFDGQVCAFSMMTDGIFDLVCSPLLNDQPCPIYVSFIRRFLDRNILAANNEKDFEALQDRISGYISSDKFSRNYNISDDKTLVGVINTDIIPALKSDEYYAEPDWKALHKNMTDIIYNRKRIDELPKGSDVSPNADDGKMTDTTVNHAEDEKPSKYQRQKIIELENALARERERIKYKDKRLTVFGIVILAQLLILIILVLVLIFGNGSDPSDKKSASFKPAVSSATKEEKNSKKADTKPETTTTAVTKTTPAATSETSITTSSATETTSSQQTTKYPEPQGQDIYHGLKNPNNGEGYMDNNKDDPAEQSNDTQFKFDVPIIKPVD